MRNPSPLYTPVVLPLITFVIPAYNVPMAMLRTCVESIQRLSLLPEEREILLIDDGSDHPVAEQLGAWADGVECIRTENRGPGAARNTGVEHAHGRFIQFVDSDDFLLPAVYDACVERLRTDDFDLLQFHYTRNPREHAWSSVTFSPVTSGAAHLAHHNLRAAVWSFVVRRSVIGDLRFTGILCGEDEAFTPRLLLRVGRMTATQAPAYCYCVREGSIVNMQDECVLRQRVHDVLGVILGLQTLLSTLDGEAYRGVERRVYQLTMDFLYHLLRNRAMRSQWRAGIRQLRQAGLFPLPLRCYTLKYFLFAFASRGIAF